MPDDYIKMPRLYVDGELQENAALSFTPEQHHYLKNVLRQEAGDRLRLFNGRDGEWAARITTIDKKSAAAAPERLLRPQPPPPRELHLLFAPIKKARLDMLVEKAVELGVTRLHPVLTRHCEVRDINLPRLQAQVIEAAEQCERLTIPACTSLQKLEDALAAWPAALPLYACLERRTAPLLAQAIKPGPAAFLIGPEGGFAPDEAELLAASPVVSPVTLGETVYRAETAALISLTLATFT